MGFVPEKGRVAPPFDFAERPRFELGKRFCRLHAFQECCAPLQVTVIQIVKLLSKHCASCAQVFYHCKDTKNS